MDSQIALNKYDAWVASGKAGMLKHEVVDALAAALRSRDVARAPEGEPCGIRIEGVNGAKRCGQIVSFEEIERAAVKDPFEWYKEFLNARYGGPFKFSYKIDRAPRSRDAARAEQPVVAWRPMETAPKDGVILLKAKGQAKARTFDDIRLGLWHTWPGGQTGWRDAHFNESLEPTGWSPIPVELIRGDLEAPTTGGPA